MDSILSLTAESCCNDCPMSTANSAAIGGITRVATVRAHAFKHACTKHVKNEIDRGTTNVSCTSFSFLLLSQFSAVSCSLQPLLPFFILMYLLSYSNNQHQIRSQQDDGSGNHLLGLVHFSKPQPLIFRMIAWKNDELCLPQHKSTAWTK